MTQTPPRTSAKQPEPKYSSRFLTLNRWSLIGMLWLFVGTFSSVIVRRSGATQAETFVGVGIAVLASLVGTVVLETRPELRLETREHSSGWLRWGMLAHLIVLAVCAVVLLFGPAEWKAASAIAVGAAFFSVQLAFLPFMAKQRMWTTLALACALASVFLFGSVEIAAIVVVYSIACVVMVPFTT